MWKSIKTLNLIIITLVCVQTAYAQARSSFIQGSIRKGTFINWEEGKRYVQAEGIGVWPKTGCKEDPDWCQLMAEDAAREIARANLLDLVKGVIVERETTVGDLVSSSQIQTYNSGIIRGARMVGEPVVKGKTVKVTMRMPLDGNLTETALASPEMERIFAEQVQDQTKELQGLRNENAKLRDQLADMDATHEELRKKQQTTMSLLEKLRSQDVSTLVAELFRQFKKQEALVNEVPKDSVAAVENALKAEKIVNPRKIPTGLIIDASGFSVEPVKFIRLLDENHNEVYSNRFIDRDYAIKFGGAGYVRGLQNAKNQERLKINGTVRPLVMKPVGTFQNKGRDFILSNEDAQKLRDWLQTASFLREARVIVAM